MKVRESLSDYAVVTEAVKEIKIERLDAYGLSQLGCGLVQIIPKSVDTVSS